MPTFEQARPIFDWLMMHPALLAFLVIVMPFLGYFGRFAYQSSISPKVEKAEKARPRYFTKPELLNPPADRRGYSDRMAYFMSELSHLAYYEFEKSDDVVAQMLEEPVPPEGHPNQMSADEKERREVQTAVKLLAAGGNTEVLRNLLKQVDIELIDTLDEDQVQGFICKALGAQEGGRYSYSFLVVAFRGSEKKVDDWLTNVDGDPIALDNNALVHSGFYSSVSNPTVAQKISRVIDEGYPRLPLYFTGHSLGGAWALLASAIHAPSRVGACYTFGAPRTANYDFFFPLKVPVYRVVNSADIVPRLPPAEPVVLTIYYFFQFLAEMTRWMPFVPRLLTTAANWVYRLKDYRHHGDERYLTDVKEAKWESTKLLHNPAGYDRLRWAMHAIRAYTPFVPLKSHSMFIYRDKLASLAARKQV